MDNVQNRNSSRVFIYILFVIKPFIDLTWEIRLFAIGGVAFNTLDVAGFCVSIIAGYLYFFHNDNKKVFNKSLIWLFIGLNLFTSITTIFFYNRSIVFIADKLVKLFDAYFIYFIGFRAIQNNKDKLLIVCIIWITTLSLGMLSIFLHSFGTFKIDITQGVVRFAGLYSDPGTPSYNAIMSIIFGTLYLELFKRQKQHVALIGKIALILTYLVTIFILMITITKSAILMLLVFLVMWIGIYKKKYYIILPLILISGSYIYKINENVQIRLSTEVEFLQEDEFSLERARAIGTGRVAVWIDVLNYYVQEFDLFQKLFGSTSTFGAHNQYIAYLMQLGIVGLMVFLIILLRFYRQLIYLYRKHKQPDLYMSIVILTVFVVYGITGHPFQYTTLLWYLMIMLSMINIYTYKTRPQNSFYSNIQLN